jgi:hypothetical protein
VIRKYDVLTDINNNISISPKTFSVYPNPATNMVNISFNVFEERNIEIKIFDLYGNLTKSLLNTYRSPGNYKLTWDTTDNEGSYVKPGTYFIQIKTGKYIMTKRVVIVN